MTWSKEPPTKAEGAMSLKPYEQRRIDAGLCLLCKAPRANYATRCDECHGKHVEAQRERLGVKKWRPGKPGRPPKIKPEDQS